MTREELLEKVNGVVDTTTLKSLSQQTIEEELDDVLEDIDDDEILEDKVVEKLAKRLKRMDGNIHANVSAESKKNRERAKDRERKRKANSNDEEDEAPDDKYTALEAKINELVAANEAREKAAKKNATLSTIREGLKAKFDKAGLEVNDFFMDIAMSKLNISDEDDINVETLIKKAESIYTSDYKRATGQAAVPGRGKTGTPSKEANINAHEFDDIIERRKKRFGSVDAKK